MVDDMHIELQRLALGEQVGNADRRTVIVCRPPRWWLIRESR
jgi:hypothetical protein